MTKQLSILVFCLGFFISKPFAQGIAIGQWRDHLPYNNCVSVADAGNRIYCATKFTLMYVEKTDNSVHKLTKSEGLSDFGISLVAFDTTSKALIVAYSNTNIDIIVNNKIYNLADIKNKTILGKKSINNIIMIDGLAYLSCGFGIVVLDPINRIIKDTYYIGNNSTAIQVFDITIDGTNLIAATENGLYFAPKNHPFLADYHNWKKDMTLPYPDKQYNAVEYFGGKLIANLNISTPAVYNMDTLYIKENGKWRYFDSINLGTYNNVKKLSQSNGNLMILSLLWFCSFDSNVNIAVNYYSYLPYGMVPSEVVKDSSGLVWIADAYIGLSSNRFGNDFVYYTILGPLTTNVYDMYSSDGNIWLVPGGRNDAWNNSWNQEGISSFINEKWTSYKSTNKQFDSVYDLLTIAVDPFNSQKVYAGSWGLGVIEMTNGVVTNMYNDLNSSLQTLSSYRSVRTAGMTFDKDGNLWVTNALVDRPLSVKMTDGTWKSFGFSPDINSEDYPSSIIIDDVGQKWIIIARGGGLFVFKDNNTIANTADDQFTLLNTQTGKGALPSANVTCIAKDLDGEVWIGSDHGIAVCYQPENIFSNGANFDVQQIVVQQGAYTQYMLENEIVTAIAVDGANKKWIGTQTAGVFYLSADGTEQIYHFDSDNSPLCSNTITSIAINDKTGEVFFGTSIGIFSYKGQSTTPVEEITNVYAYPNPVYENYNGYIAIKGLVKDTYVKITDITGKLVYSIKAEGGQAIWQARNHNGERVTTGVYLAYCTNTDGTQTAVVKILVM